MTPQLADRSHAYSESKIEDVLMKVGKFIFPVDFIVLDFKAEKNTNYSSCTFLSHMKTLIDVQKGELIIRVNDQQITFNVLDTMKNPDEVENCNTISVVDVAATKRLNSYCSKEEINAATFEELEEENVAAVYIAWLGEKQPARHN